jgi:uncharacterized Zn finger protein
MMISLHNFESEIDESILDRGLSYWKNGNVIELKQTGNNEFEAIVSGNEDYEVKIKLADDNIQDFTCTCPYDWGPVCKHVAAVLFALQEGNLSGLKEAKAIKKSKGKISQKNSLKKQFEDILSRLGKEELAGWIRTWADKDELFRNYFIFRFNENTEKIDIEKYTRILGKELRAAEDRYGFIDYYHSGDAVNEALQLLNDTENNFTTAGTAEIISLCFAVINVIAPALTNSDDSDGEISGAVEQAVELIARTSQEKELADDIKKELFELCLKYADSEGMDIDSWDLDMLKVAGQLISNQKDKGRLFSALDQKDKAASWHYTNERTAQIRKEVIERLDGKEAAGKYAESMLHLPEIRRQFVEKYIQEKNYSKAKELCEKGIIMDKKWAGIVNEWHEFLLSIAEKEKDISEIIRLATLLFLATFNSQRFYPVIKKYTPSGQWEQTVEFLIQQLKKKNSDDYITWIHIQEGMFDRLLSYVQAKPSPINIEHFEQYLKPLYPEELKNLYEKAIRNYALHASKRNAYAECCRLLRRMKKLGDKNRIEVLVNELTITYKSRPAFIDELKRV